MVEVTKQQKMDAAIAAIKKQFGNEHYAISASLAGSSFQNKENIFPTGILTLDIMLNGGYPKGRIIELFGSEGSGKSTVALTACATAQRDGHSVVYVDVEGTFDKDYAKILGVDCEKLVLCQPDYGEDAADVIRLLVDSGGVDLIVVDSIAALVPKAEIDSSASDAHMGLQAKMLSKFMRSIQPSLTRTKCTIICINQIRDKLGITFGPTRDTPGGHAIKHSYSVRIEVKQGQLIKNGDVCVGQTINFSSCKNKAGGNPKGKSSCVLMYGIGIPHVDMVVDVAVQYDIIHKAGSWFSYNDQKIGQGSANVSKYLEDNPETFKEVEKLILTKSFPFFYKEEIEKEAKKSKKEK
jgi:recombination protein RecA